MARRKVFFLTGVDQHGQKVQQSAEKAGVSPQQFVDEITAKFIALWEKLEVRYDVWAATTDPLHKRCVQGMLQRLYDEKQIYKDKQEGYYSIRQEQFLTDKERGPDGEFGPEWGAGRASHGGELLLPARPAQGLAPRLSARSSRLRHSGFPPDRAVNAVEKLNGDLCISRPKSRLSWGIELPFDRDYVNYVWFDALTNYISFIGYDPTLSTFDAQPSTFREKWPALHILGKDILIPAHGIYWPIMLHALGFPDEQMPKFLVHGWWNVSGTKMSKSLGNVVDPDALADKYGAEALRYYLMSDIATGLDANFAEERLVTQYNSRLANNIGNLLSRTLRMVGSYCDGRVKRTEDATLQSEAGMLKLLQHGSFERGSHDNYRRWMQICDPDQALAEIDLVATTCNGYLEHRSPWKLARDKANTDAVDAIIYTVVEALRVIAVRLSPVLPNAAHGIFDQLNWKIELSGKEERFSLGEAEWGKLPDGHVVGKPTPLFPRIEQDAG